MSHRPWNVLALSLMAASLPVSVHAANARAPGVEQIVITAERRASTVQDTSQSVTAFSSDFLKEYGLRTSEDLQHFLPATVIQPYDISIRGVGRLFRAAGGDPGVATYFNGAYTEDFGIIASEGSLYDLDRIEVLRGPQGTLYGRNGVGGAINFHSKLPSHEPSAELGGGVASYDGREIYGYATGPLVEDLLAWRVTATNRSRSGFLRDISNNGDINDYGDENYALGLLFTPLENVSLYVRANERSYHRRVGGAANSGAIVLSENGGLVDQITRQQRNSTARVFGYRILDTRVNGTLVSAASSACANFTDRTQPNCFIAANVLPTTLVNEFDPSIFQYTATTPIATRIDTNFDLMPDRAVAAGDVITRRVQRVVPGVDPSIGLNGAVDTFARPNFQFGHDRRLADAVHGDGFELPELEGEELRVDTNGGNRESADHQNATWELTWDVSDALTVKWIGGYTDYIYLRNTDDDRTGNVFGGTGIDLDLQFHTNQENENFSQELQFLFDLNDNVKVTSGLFYYSNNIDLRVDQYSPNLPRYTRAAAGATGAAQTGTTLDWNSARDRPTPIVVPALAINFPGCGSGATAVTQPAIAALNPVASSSVSIYCQAQGPWAGEAGDRVPHGPLTPGTSFVWNTNNQTTATAIYAQADWKLNAEWALTLGGRWGSDEKEGTENLFNYSETTLTGVVGDGNLQFAGFDAANAARAGMRRLLAYNVASGAMNADGSLTQAGANESIPVRFRGLPGSTSNHRALENDFDEATWRANLDWTPSNDQLLYGSVSTSYRAGGFNLGYYSVSPTYDSEKILAFEIGHKGRFFEGRVQANSSVFLYQYEDIHLQQYVESVTGLSLSVSNGPEARTLGFETEVQWLPTDRIALGAVYSYTDSEYTDEFVDPISGERGVVDITDPARPPSVFEADINRLQIEGEPLTLSTEHKFNVYGSYRVLTAANGTLDLLSSYSWQDEVNHRVLSSALDVGPAAGRWDLRMTWTSPSGLYEAHAFVNNVLDEVSIRQLDIETEDKNFLRTAEVTDPRVFGIELRARWGGR